jgi:hypothetical protein
VTHPAFNFHCAIFWNDETLTANAKQEEENAELLWFFIPVPHIEELRNVCP